MIHQVTTAWQLVAVAAGDEHATFAWRHVWIALFAIAAIACLIALLKFVRWCQDRGWFCSGWPALFHELCTAHRISTPRRRLLAEVAQQMQLPSAAVLFVRPDLMKLAFAGNPENRETLKAIAESIFAGVDWKGPVNTPSTQGTSSTAIPLGSAPALSGTQQRV